ncbi:MAG: hypothetical protein VYE22_33010 [Myxococcota bacterium]|nr:hypothetical protein [Myxococcota bacterium]
MLPAYIIEELRRREEVLREEERRPQPRLELPIPTRQQRPSEPPEGGDRGVAIIQLM